MTVTQTQRAKTMAMQTNPSKPVAPATPAPNSEAKRTRTKKEDMPFKFTFLDAKNQETGRIPTDVTAIKTTFSDGKVVLLPLKDVPTQTKQQLEADALRRRFTMFLKDITKDNIKEALGISEEFIKVIKTNTLYLPKEGGGGPGRAFDFDFWIEVFERTAKAKHEVNPKVALMTEKNKVALRTRLEAMSPDDRNAKKKEWEAKDPVMRKVAQLIRIERDAAKSKGDDSYDPMVF